MSFPRAKIQRFNDVKSCTPSPADYNVDLKDRPTGAIIPQSERFLVPQSPANSETSSQCSNGTPCSKKATCAKKRTPQSFKKPKTKDFSAADDLETLQEKIVEITNKDMFINELVEQQEDFKQKISDMQKSFDEKEKNLREKHDLELKELVNKHDKELDEVYNRILEMDMQIKGVRSEYNELKIKNEADLAEISKNISDFNDISKSFNEELKKKSDEVRNKTEDLNQLRIAYDELKAANASKIDELNRTHKTEMEEMQFEMLKTVTEMQKQIEKTHEECKEKVKLLEISKTEEMEKLREFFDEEKEKIKNESEMQIKQMKEDFREAEILSEMQFNEKFKEIEMEWTSKLENQEKQSDQILKECQAISEYNIIQSEVEKNQIKSELTKKCKEQEELINKLEDFKKRAENISKMLEEKTKEIETIEEKNKLEIEKKASKEKTYQITISKLYETIEALKKRLINSDRDVEQLKTELELCEKSKLETEDRCNKIKEELKILQSSNEELEMQHEYAVKLMEDKIRKAEKILHEKVEDYKIAAKKIEDDLRKKLEEKEKILGDVMEQLSEQQKLIGESQKLFKSTKMEMEKIEAENIDFEYKNKCLEMAGKRMEKELENVKKRNLELEQNLEKTDLENSELKRELNNTTKVSSEEIENFTKQITILQEKSDSYYQYCEYYKNKCAENESELDELIEVRKKYIEQSGRHDELLQKCEALERENAEMKTRIAQQESLIGPFREQLQAYEMEHRALLSEKRDAEAEAREVGLKYASILGHQNNKQKIKYLVDLQAKKFDLIEEKKALESKVRSQSRTIEKLKKEVNALSKPTKKGKTDIEDKENINSPSRNFNSSQCESPGVLRERNLK